MKTKILLLVRVLFLTSILGCKSCTKSDSPVSPTISGVLIPLKIGNKWIYQDKQFDNPINPKIGKDTLYIIKDTIINGETWYIPYGEINIPCINRSDGFYSMLPDSLQNFNITLLFKYPANIGDMWNTGDSNREGNYTLLSKNDTVTVTAGTFICYKYQSESQFSDILLYQKSLFWICPGIGEIKIEDWESFDTNKLSLYHSSELLSYELK
ncbi:MAG: hypothetical protein ABSG15_01060 [FCB group bacterium]